MAVCARSWCGSSGFTAEEGALQDVDQHRRNMLGGLRLALRYARMLSLRLTSNGFIILRFYDALVLEIGKECKCIVNVEVCVYIRCRVSSVKDASSSSFSPASYAEEQDRRDVNRPL